jgi:hypothetical protein
LSACGGGVHLQLQLPPSLDLRSVGSLVVEVQGHAASPLGPAVSSRSERLTADGRLLITLDAQTLSQAASLGLDLRPTSSRPSITNVGACALDAAGGLIAVSHPVEVDFSPNLPVQPLTFACERAGCVAATNPPFQEVQGLNNDNLVPLAVSHFTSTDDTFVVAGAPTRLRGGMPTGAVFLFARAPRACPESPLLAARTIFGRPGDQLGAAAAGGDFDGDGLEDLAVSGLLADGSGVVYVVPNPVLTARSTIDLADSAQAASVWRIVGSGADGFGTALAFAALTKSPATDSLVVLAPSGQALRGDGHGLLYVLYGTAANLGQHALGVGYPLAIDGAVLRGAGAGTAMAGFVAGDANGDGRADVTVTYSSTLGGALAVVDGRLLAAAGDRRLADDGLLVSGTGDRLFGAAVAPGTFSGNNLERWNVVVGSPNEGKVLALTLPAATFWDETGEPLAPKTVNYKDARLNTLTVLGRAGFGNALVLGTLSGQVVKTLVVANEKLGQVAALRTPPAGTMWDLRDAAALAAASVATLVRADALDFGTVIRAGYTLADFIVGGKLVDQPRGLFAVYALPSQ